jgi:YbbR domain-containing protein
MTTIWHSFLSKFLGRVVEHWPLKVAAITASLIIWLVVSSASVTVTQRSLHIPIYVEGLSSDQIASGVPNFVEVTISGPNNRVAKLNPESFYAFIDLAGYHGSFEGSIEVSTPKRVDLIAVSPLKVIGTVEVVTTKLVPVSVFFHEPIPEGRLIHTIVDPAGVLVRGRGPVLNRVTRVMAPTPARTGTYEVGIFAADLAGIPVPEITVQPEIVTVNLKSDPIIMTRTVPLNVTKPEVLGLIATVTSTHHLIELVGPWELLGGLNSVSGTVKLATLNPVPGDYNLPVSVSLPEGLIAKQISTAQVRLALQP